MWWTVCVDCGPKRVNHAAVAVGDLIYSFGGYCTGKDYKRKTPMDVHVLNTVTLRWKSLPVPKPGDEQYKEAPYKRYGHTAVYWKGKAYIWGGRNDEYVDNILYSFDPGTHLWTKIETVGRWLPAPRDGHSACVIENSNVRTCSAQMFVFGGFDETIDRFTDELCVLDLPTMHWRKVDALGRPPSYRDFHTALAVGGRMYVWGGRGGAGSEDDEEEAYSQDMHYLETNGGGEQLSWHKPSVCGQIPIGRRSHSAFVYGEQHILVFGGFNGIINQHFNDLHAFDTTANRWRRLETRGLVPTPRRRQACIPVASRVFMFGGTSPKQHIAGHNEDDDADNFDDDDYNENGMLNTELVDHSDLYVLEFLPSLKTLSIFVAIQFHGASSLLACDLLPKEIKSDIELISGTGG